MHARGGCTAVSDLTPLQVGKDSEMCLMLVRSKIKLDILLGGWKDGLVGKMLATQT